MYVNRLSVKILINMNHILWHAKSGKNICVFIIELHLMNLFHFKNPSLFSSKQFECILCLFVCLLLLFLSYLCTLFLGLDCCDCCSSGLELAVCPQHVLLFEFSGIRYYFLLVSCWSWWWQGKIHSQMCLHMAVGVCVCGGWGGWVSPFQYTVASLNPGKQIELTTKPFSIDRYITSSLNEWTRKDGLWKKILMATTLKWNTLYIGCGRSAHAFCTCLP